MARDNEQGFIEAGETSMRTFDLDTFAAIIAQKVNERQANLRDQATNPQCGLVKVGPIPLDTAPLNPYRLPGPIKAIVLKDVTDDNVRVSLATGTDAKFAMDMAYPLDHNEALNFSDDVPSAYLTWTAQSGKTATLYVGIGVEIRPGKIISVQSGGVTISEGSGVTTRAKTGLTINSVPAIILPADTSRKVETLINNEGTTIFVGDLNVTDDSGTYPGIPVEAGGVFYWRNTQALYAVSKGGVTLNNFGRTEET